eukprot:PITA_21095
MMYQFQQKLRYLKGHLKRWNRETFGDIFKAQQSLNLELTDLHQKIITEGHIEGTLEQERCIHSQIQDRQKQEETQGGEKLERHEEIEAKLRNHFNQILQEPEGDRRTTIEKITNNVPRIVKEEHNELLLRPITPQEVDEAMFQLKEGKAPGLDGFTSTFFHTF